MRVGVRTKAGIDRHLGTSLPIDWREDPSILAAGFLIVFGAAFAGFASMALYAVATGGRISGSPTGLAIIATVFLVIGLTIFAVGVNGLFLRTTIRIDDSTVRFKRTGLIWGAADWTERLSAFQGVLASQQYRSGGKNRSSYTEYQIHLKHERDRGRDIELYQSRSGANHRDETEGFATLLALPVLTEREDGRFETRDAADLDKSLRQRVEEGNLNPRRFHVDFIPRGSALKVSTMSQGYAFEVSMMGDLPVASISTVVGLGLLYWYFGPGLPDGEGPMWVVPVVGGVSALVGLQMIHTALFRVERLEVSPSGVRIGQVRPGSALGSSDRRALRANEIEEVGLRKDKHGGFKLTISGDRQTLTWGQYLSTAERELVRDAITQTLVS